MNVQIWKQAEVNTYLVDYTSGSGSSTLTFNYTVQSGHNTSDLDYASTSALVLNGGTINDAAGNATTLTLAAPGATNSLGANKSLVIDTTVPTVASVTANKTDGIYNVDDVIPITVTFSEAIIVTGFPQLTLETGTTDAAVNYTSGSSTNTLSFFYTVSAGHNSSDLDYASTSALALNSGTIKDAAGNAATLTLAAPGATNSLGANKAIVIDTQSPTVASVTSTSNDGTYKIGDVIPITVTFSEAVSIVGGPQITLETGDTDAVVNYTSGSGSSTLTFNYTVSEGESSSDLDYASTSALGLNNGTIKDASGNNATLTLAAPGAANSLGNAKAIVVDGIRATVTSVTSTVADNNYDIGEVIPIVVNFSEVVTVTGTPQITLETGTADAVVNYTSGTGTNALTFNYTVVEGHLSSDLDYISTNALALNGGTINDGAGNASTLTLAAPGAASSLGNAKAIVVDGVLPTIASVSSSSNDGAYKFDDTIPITITFSEAVTVTGTPVITLETGLSDAVVTYTTGSGTSTLTFNYTVLSGHNTTDLDYKTSSALVLNGSTIKDASGNNATLTLPEPGATNSLGANKAIEVDGIVPTVSIVTSTLADGHYTVGQVIPVSVLFSEAVTVTGTPQITLETGSSDAVVDYSSGSGTPTIIFNYTVASGHTSSDLDYVSTSALALNGGTIKDAAGNTSIITLVTPGNTTSLGGHKGFIIDTAPATVTSVASSATDGTSYKVGDTVTLTVNFSETVTVTGTPQLTLETGDADGIASYVSGTGTNALTFNYTVVEGHASSDLDYAGTDALALNNGTILDAASNTSTLTLAAPGAANSLGANNALVVDGVTPTIASVATTVSDGLFKIGDVIPITVTFSEAISVNTTNGTPQLTLETGTTDVLVGYSSGTGTNVLTFNYTVAEGHVSSDLDYTATNALGLNSGTIQDGAGNNAILTLAAPGETNSLAASADKLMRMEQFFLYPVLILVENGYYNAGDLIPIISFFL